MLRPLSSTVNSTTGHSSCGCCHGLNASLAKDSSVTLQIPSHPAIIVSTCRHNRCHRRKPMKKSPVRKDKPSSQPETRPFQNPMSNKNQTNQHRPSHFAETPGVHTVAAANYPFFHIKCSCMYVYMHACSHASIGVCQSHSSTHACPQNLRTHRRKQTRAHVNSHRTQQDANAHGNKTAMQKDTQRQTIWCPPMHCMQPKQNRISAPNNPV